MKLYQYNTDNIVDNEFLQCIRVVSCSYKSAHDRFGNYKSEFTPCEQPKYIDKKFKDICFERTEEINKKINGQRCIVMFSGGVDSITVISLLYAHNIKFIVLWLDCSELNKLWLDWFKKHNIECIVAECIGDFTFRNDDIVIDGNCADQLSHSAFFFKDKISVRRNVINPKNKDEYLEKLLKMEEYEEWKSKAPLKLDTLNKELWYISYCFKWRDTAYQHMPCFLENKFNFTIDINNYFAFFNTTDFSDWGFSNHERNLSKDLSNPYTYKTDWKNVIVDIIKDADMQEYILSKGKGFSLSSDTLPCWNHPNPLYTYWGKDDVYLMYNDDKYKVTREKQEKCHKINLNC